MLLYALPITGRRDEPSIEDGARSEISAFEESTGLSLRGRLLRGAGGQAFAIGVRTVIQLGGVMILLPVWGLHSYGEWLILTAIPSAMAISDLGYFAAVGNDMIMAVGRGDRDGARDVFRATVRGTALVFALLALLLPLLIWVLPLNEWLNLTLSDSATSLTLMLLGFNTLLLALSGLLRGGLVSVGHYGDAAVALAGIMLLEFLAVVAAVLLTFDPVVAAAAMLTARCAGTVAMYVLMRRRVPWLTLGKPVGKPAVLRRLTKPALAATAFPSGLALNVQGTTVVIGVVAGPAAAATFGAVRTVSRIAVQALGSVAVVVGPEYGRAFAERDYGLLQKLHHRAGNAALWVSAPILLTLAAAGPVLLDFLTGGRINVGAELLYLLLLGAGLDSLWYTSLAVLLWTNRHQRIGVTFLAAQVLTIPLTYVLLERMGLDGAALALVLLEAFMLGAVLRQSLPAAHDELGLWLRAILAPPTWALSIGSRARRGRTRR